MNQIDTMNTVRALAGEMRSWSDFTELSFLHLADTHIEGWGNMGSWSFTGDSSTWGRGWGDTWTSPPPTGSAYDLHPQVCPQCGRTFFSSAYGSIPCPDCSSLGFLQVQQGQETLTVEELEMLAQMMQRGLQLDALEGFVQTISKGSLMARFRLYQRAWEVLRARVPELVPSRALELSVDTPPAQEE